MASVGGDDGGNSINVELNIVPFIDLMCTCIIFLLVTAVWTQVSMIQLGSSIYGKKVDPSEMEPPPHVEVPLKLDIRADGYYVTVGKQETKFARVAGEAEVPPLFAFLQDLKAKYPEKNDAIIAVAEELPYEDLVRGMDNLLNAGFPEIAVATGEAK